MKMREKGKRIRRGGEVEGKRKKERHRGEVKMRVKGEIGRKGSGGDMGRRGEGYERE